MVVVVGGFTSVGGLCDLPKKLNFEGFRFGVVLILSAHKVDADSALCSNALVEV
jgi:hypothetical protein